MSASSNADTTVAQLIRTAAVTVDIDEPIERVYGLMAEHGVRFVAVRQDGRITAVLDREQLKLRLAAATRQLRVHDVIHPGMACLPADATPQAAMRLMRATSSAAVPVLDKGHRFVGLVTAEGLVGVDP